MISLILLAIGIYIAWHVIGFIIVLLMLGGGKE